MAQQQYYPAPPQQQQKGSGLAITSLVLGIVALLLCWIPVVNYLAVILGVLGLVLGAIGIARSRRTMSIIGTVLSLLAIILSFVIMASFVDAVDDAVDDYNSEVSSSPSAPGEMEGGDAALDAEASANADPGAGDDGDPLSDGGWTASDVQVEVTQFGTSITGRITNTDAASRSGIFTLTIFDAAGARIGETQGSVSDVEAGGTATVTFIGMTSTEQLPGDPATYTYELQNDGSY